MEVLGYYIPEESYLYSGIMMSTVFAMIAAGLAAVCAVLTAIGLILYSIPLWEYVLAVILVLIFTVNHFFKLGIHPEIIEKPNGIVPGSDIVEDATCPSDLGGEDPAFVSHVKNSFGKIFGYGDLLVKAEGDDALESPSASGDADADEDGEVKGYVVGDGAGAGKRKSSFRKENIRSFREVAWGVGTINGSVAVLLISLGWVLYHTFTKYCDAVATDTEFTFEDSDSVIIIFLLTTFHHVITHDCGNYHLTLAYTDPVVLSQRPSHLAISKDDVADMQRFSQNADVLEEDRKTLENAREELERDRRELAFKNEAIDQEARRINTEIRRRRNLAHEDKQALKRETELDLKAIRARRRALEKKEADLKAREAQLDDMRTAEENNFNVAPKRSSTHGTAGKGTKSSINAKGHTAGSERVLHHATGRAGQELRERSSSQGPEVNTPQYNGHGQAVNKNSEIRTRTSATHDIDDKPARITKISLLGRRTPQIESNTKQADLLTPSPSPPKASNAPANPSSPSPAPGGNKSVTIGKDASDDIEEMKRRMANEIQARERALEDKYTSMLAAAEARVMAAEAKLQATSTASSQMETANEKKVSERAQAGETQIKQLVQQLSAAEDVAKAATAANEAITRNAQACIHHLEAGVEQTRSQLQEQTRHNESLEAFIEELKVAGRALEAQNASLKPNWQAGQETSIRGQTGQQAQLNRIQVELARAQNAYRSQVAEVADLSQRLGRTNDSLRTAQAEVSAKSLLQVQNEQMLEQWGRRADDWQRERAELNQAVTDAQVWELMAEGQAVELEKQSADLKDQIAGLEQQRDAFHGQVEGLTEDRNLWRVMCQSEMEDNEALLAQNEALAAQNELNVAIADGR